MKARVSLTPQMMEKLVKRESILFRINPGVTVLEVRLLENEGAFSQFYGVFAKAWKTLLSKMEFFLK